MAICNQYVLEAKQCKASCGIIAEIVYSCGFDQWSTAAPSLRRNTGLITGSV